MKKTVTFYINDEPLSPTATEQRQATIKYDGPRYLYLEYCTDEECVMAPVHWSEEPELEVAEERRTIDDCRVILELDAQDTVFPIAVMLNTTYKMTIDNYTETLPDGEVYTFEYPEDPDLDSIYDIKNMRFNPETKDYDEWLYDVNDVTDEEFLESIDGALQSVNDDIDEGEFTEEEMVAVNAYKAELNQLKIDYVTGIYGPVPHWKLGFPSLDLGSKIY